jgi:hypothetical protein
MGRVSSHSSILEHTLKSSLHYQQRPSTMPIGTAFGGLPAQFVPSMILYHLLPLHMPLTLFFLDAPFGRFSNAKSIFKVNGERTSPKARVRF